VDWALASASRDDEMHKTRQFAGNERCPKAPASTQVCPSSALVVSIANLTFNHHHPCMTAIIIVTTFGRSGNSARRRHAISPATRARRGSLLLPGLIALAGSFGQSMNPGRDIVIGLLRQRCMRAWTIVQ
jgi:hypothetical protein